MASADADCQVFCPSNYLPVCAQSEEGGSPRTFANQCALDFEICDKKQSKFFDSFYIQQVKIIINLFTEFTVVVESACP